MKLTIWLKGSKVTLYIGGDIDKGKAPIVTAELKGPQILIEPDKSRVEIKEEE